LNWLNRLERKIGRYAVRGLMTYIVGLNALVFMMMLIEPSIINWLELYPAAVLRGEVWRIITFTFIPPSFSILWIIFTLYFYYLVGNSLEHEWGSFKFNIYYLIGAIGTIAAAFITGYGASAFYLNTSLFLAFAYIYPNFEMRLFFFLPVKVKYLAWLNAVFIIYTVIADPLPFKAAAIVSVLNFLLFFGKDMVLRVRTRGQSYNNRRKFSAKLPRDFTIHRCTICGMTEKDDPKMDFRYCMLCEGDYEYCQEHLNTHEHIKSDHMKQ
jgi:membrane associated rhomboid family serine protease